jgi:hypothetical protein
LQACLEHREITAQIPKLLKKYELKLTVDALSKRRDDYGAYLEKSLGMLFPDANKRAAIIEKWLVSWTESQTAHLKAQGWRTECDDIVPVRLKALLEEPEETEVSTHSHGSNSVVDRRHNRDAYDALEAAARDLIRLDRYQQGAWLRQKRAIHQLAKIRLDRRSACGRRPPTANDSRPSHPE